MKEIKLNHNQTLYIDDEDFDRVSQYHWYCKKFTNTYYAMRKFTINGRRKEVKLHRFILGITDPKIQIDHKDRNGLNNQKSNLRLCTGSQNCMNRAKISGCHSKYKGVTWYPKYNKWNANIKINKKCINLGYYENEDVAAKSYNEAALKYKGQKAKLNVLPEQCSQILNQYK